MTRASFRPGEFPQTPPAQPVQLTVNRRLHFRRSALPAQHAFFPSVHFQARLSYLKSLAHTHVVPIYVLSPRLPSPYMRHVGFEIRTRQFQGFQDLARVLLSRSGPASTRLSGLLPADGLRPPQVAFYAVASLLAVVQRVPPVSRTADGRGRPARPHVWGPYSQNPELSSIPVDLAQRGFERGPAFPDARSLPLT